MRSVLRVLVVLEERAGLLPSITRSLKRDNEKKLTDGQTLLSGTIVTMKLTMRRRIMAATAVLLCAGGLLSSWAQAGKATTPAAAVHEEWIPMPDGVRLAVNLLTSVGDWKTHRSPVILEYLPYRKDDWSIERDLELHSYWVQQGYVVARVDIRGTGRSEGELPDREYSEQELKDGEAVIAWLAAQSWSNGSVGMMGISWGGFNSIQMAMRQPPALEGHHRRGRHGRSVQRRYSLHRRLDARRRIRTLDGSSARHDAAAGFSYR